MMSGVYAAAKAGLLGSVDLLARPVSALLVDLQVYTPDLENDTRLSDIPESAVIAEAALVGKQIIGGCFTADPTVFPTVESDGADITGVVVFVDGPTDNDTLLLCVLDDSTAFPITPDGSDVVVEWADPPVGILAL